MVASGDRDARQIMGIRPQERAGVLEPRDARESLGGNAHLVAEAFGEVTTAPADRRSKRCHAITAVTGGYTIPGKANLAGCRGLYEPPLQHLIEYGEASFPRASFMQSLIQLEIDARADYVAERKDAVREGARGATEECACAERVEKEMDPGDGAGAFDYCPCSCKPATNEVNEPMPAI